MSIHFENTTSCLVCDSKNSKIVKTTKTMMGSQSWNWQFHQCQDCGMVYLNPRVPEVELGAYYTDAYLPYRGASAWGRYANLVEGDQRKIDSKRLKTVQKYMTGSVKSILDIGCGKPTFLELVQEKTGLSSIGLDFSNKGWRDELGKYSKLELHEGSVEDLAPEVKADVITMWHYLEHDYRPKDTLKHLSNSQQKGTILIIEVPNHDSYTARKYGEYWSGYHSPRHTGLYTPKTMKDLLERSGWHVLDQYEHGTLDPYTLDWMSRMERKSIDWTDSMESYFYGYILGKILRPRYFFDTYSSLGFMTTIAQIPH